MRASPVHVRAQFKKKTLEGIRREKRVILELLTRLKENPRGLNEVREFREVRSAPRMRRVWCVGGWRVGEVMGGVFGNGWWESICARG